MAGQDPENPPADFLQIVSLTDFVGEGVALAWFGEPGWPVGCGAAFAVLRRAKLALIGAGPCYPPRRRNREAVRFVIRNRFGHGSERMEHGCDSAVCG